MPRKTFKMLQAKAAEMRRRGVKVYVERAYPEPYVIITSKNGREYPRFFNTIDAAWRSLVRTRRR